MSMRCWTTCPREFEVTASFQKDFKKLKAEHKAAFKQVVRDRFATARDAWAEANAARKSYVCRRTRESMSSQARQESWR